MILATGATVAVVDGEKLALFRNSGRESVELSALPVPEIEPGTASRGHHSSGANPDNDTQAEDGFAGGVAALLNKHALEGKIDALLVIAAPKTLGELRKHWHKALEAKLVGEIAKDLTGQPTEQIAKAIDAA
ncbi:MAG: host attachment protein [Pseudomonadota bacterium]